MEGILGFSKIHLYQQSPANVRESSLGTARYACLLDIFSQSENDFVLMNGLCLI